MNVWDRCLLDESQAGLVSQFEESIKYLEQNENESNVIVSRALPTTLQCTGINGYKESLFVSEKYCDTFALELESILNLLTDLSSSFIDVTRRTNSLMMNCEHLLEQQVFVTFSIVCLSKVIFLAFSPINSKSAS